GSWRLISVRVLIARNDGPSLASHGASRLLQIFKAPACDFRAPAYKKCAECEGVPYSVVAGQQCEAVMALASDIVLVTLLCVVRDGAPARFPIKFGLSLHRFYLQSFHVIIFSSIISRNFELQLVPNRRLVSPEFRVWSDQGQEATLSAVDPSCHFQHAGSNAVAAFSACKDHALHGLIVVDNSTYEVRPLPLGSGRAENGSGRTAHVIRRAPPPAPPGDDARLLRPRVRRPRTYPPRLKPGPPNYTIEIALFLDEAAYKIFYPYLNYSESDLRDMLLAYINGVQALYQHSSLGTHIQLSLVRLTLLRSQPSSLPAHAERGRLLDSFCAYQRSLNVDDDDDPQHWDMALLLSGLDFYSEEGGRRNGVTMGLAPVGGVCLPAHACVVSEFGTSDLLGRPYPSAGFTSVYILAHEIGHKSLLGRIYIGIINLITVTFFRWATCLFDGSDDLDAPSELQHERFGGAPGAIWSAKKQCEVSDWCQGGECVPSKAVPTSSTTSKPDSDADSTVSGGWSPWREASCQSGCSDRSRGFRERRRVCMKPSSDACHGASYDVVCGKKTRVGASELASRKCAEYSSLLPELDPRGGGLQAPHDPTRMWMGCAVFCRRASGGGFYAPRVELNDAGKDPYFPDGTWCHNDGSQDYYCLQHHCLPENFKMNAQWHIWELPSEDVSGPFNARALSTPDDEAAAAAIKAYLSLDNAGVPITRSALPPQIPEEPEENWEVIDYVDVPKQRKRSPRGHSPGL
ncbi:hypothetical protein HF086_009206, partial [Spodoptera exigua]